MNFLERLYHFWFKIDDKIRFVLIGGINAAISYLIFVILILIFGKTHHQLCVTGQWVISSFISFLNQKFFVFNTKGNYLNEYLKCCSAWVISYILNVIILEITIKYLISNVFLAQFISLFVVSVITYILFKYYAFKSKTEKI